MTPRAPQLKVASALSEVPSYREEVVERAGRLLARVHSAGTARVYASCVRRLLRDGPPFDCPSASVRSAWHSLLREEARYQAQGEVLFSTSSRKIPPEVVAAFGALRATGLSWEMIAAARWGHLAPSELAVDDEPVRILRPRDPHASTVCVPVRALEALAEWSDRGATPAPERHLCHCPQRKRPLTWPEIRRAVLHGA